MKTSDSTSSTPWRLIYCSQVNSSIRHCSVSTSSVMSWACSEAVSTAALGHRWGSITSPHTSCWTCAWRRRLRKLLRVFCVRGLRFRTASAGRSRPRSLKEVQMPHISKATVRRCKRHEHAIFRQAHYTHAHRHTHTHTHTCLHLHLSCNPASRINLATERDSHAVTDFTKQHILRQCNDSRSPRAQAFVAASCR